MFAILIVMGAAILVLGFKIGRKIERYEFENRGSGGNVGFQDFGASQRHQWTKFFSFLLNFLGVCGIFAGTAGLVIEAYVPALR